jgi:large subunit ribosomal protein L14e
MAVIVDVVDHKTILVDGQVRRRKCNIAHVEPTSKTVEIKKGASHQEVVAALKQHGIEVVDRKPRQKTVRQGVKARAGASKAPAAKPAAKVAPAKK